MAEDCKEKRYIVKEIIIEGEPIPGPPGPAGPPGTMPDTYPADQVTLEGLPPFDNVQQAMEYLLYVPVDITAFSCTNGTTFELGRQLTTLTFNWTVNKAIVSQTLTGPPEMTPVVLTPEQRSITVTLANLSSNATFTLQVDDGTGQDSRNVNISFLNANYWGDALIPGVIDDAFVKSLGGKQLRGNRNASYVSNAVGDQYNWYVYPTRHGAATFYAGGFEGGYQLIQTLSFTNDYGYTEDYEVYRSDFPDIGPGINIEVV